jgi:hypothetical protein
MPRMLRLRFELPILGSGKLGSYLRMQIKIETVILRENYGRVKGYFLISLNRHSKIRNLECLEILIPFPTTT